MKATVEEVKEVLAEALGDHRIDLILEHKSINLV